MRYACVSIVHMEEENSNMNQHDLYLISISKLAEVKHLISSMTKARSPEERVLLTDNWNIMKEQLEDAPIGPFDVEKMIEVEIFITSTKMVTTWSEWSIHKSKNDSIVEKWTKPFQS